MRWDMSATAWRIALAVTASAAIALLAAPASSAPAPGSYTYELLPIAGSAQAWEVAFHPDGSYAVVLERSNRVQIVDWTSRIAATHDLTPVSGSITWDDLLFDPAGGFALLVGSHVDAETEGIVYRLDDAQVRAGGTTAQIFSELTNLRDSWEQKGIEFGEFGILVVCGTSGADSLYYTEIGGVGE